MQARPGPRVPARGTHQASTWEKPIGIRRGEGGVERTGGPFWSPAVGVQHFQGDERRVTRATIKALPTHPLPARPYGSPGLLPCLAAQVEAWRVPLTGTMGCISAMKYFSTKKRVR